MSLCKSLGKFVMMAHTQNPDEDDRTIYARRVYGHSATTLSAARWWLW